MIDLLNLKAIKRQRLSSLLGLALDGSRLDGIVLRRTNGSLYVQQTFSVSLSLDPLTADSDLVGREIRNHLDAAGVRERQCVVCLPLKWALTTHADVPELPSEDLPGFLQIEAERGFPCDVATLHYAASYCHSASGNKQALLGGIPRNHLTLLERALRSARLKPLSFSLGIVALQPPAAEPSEGVVSLLVGESHVGLQVTCAGGIAALRALEGALQIEGSRRFLQADVVAREVRITLGQLPAEFRESIRRIRIFGQRDFAQHLADEIELRLESLGLKVELVTRYSPEEFGLQLPADAFVSPALSLAARHLAAGGPSFEFLLPRVTPWKQIAARYSSGKLRLAGAGAACLIVLAGAAFGIQQWQLSKLDSQWTTMASKVRELETLTQQIHQFRPWFDSSFRNLTILAKLTEAFPEEGIVSAKTVEIRDPGNVTCTGVAREKQALLKTMDKLNSTPGVSDFHGGPFRGVSPIQFSFTFSWNEGPKNAN